MTLIKHTHKPSFPGIFDDFFMRNLFDDDFMTPMKNTVPAVNIVEHDESYEMAIAAPGMKKDDFNIELDNDTLVVSAEVKEGKKEDKGRFTRHEFSRSSFERRFMLPDSADIQKIGASYEDGVLNILLPKKEEAKVQAPRQIEIA